jgi:hypothetical protein
MPVVGVRGTGQHPPSGHGVIVRHGNQPTTKEVIGKAPANWPWSSHTRSGACEKDEENQQPELQPKSGSFCRLRFGEMRSGR